MAIGATRPCELSKPTNVDSRCITCKCRLRVQSNLMQSQAAPWQLIRSFDLGMRSQAVSGRQAASGCAVQALGEETQQVG